jgi:hypothetical protein
MRLYGTGDARHEGHDAEDWLSANERKRRYRPAALSISARYAGQLGTEDVGLLITVPRTGGRVPKWGRLGVSLG